jgi:hypothetical protein
LKKLNFLSLSRDKVRGKNYQKFILFFVRKVSRKFGRKFSVKSLFWLAFSLIAAEISATWWQHCMEGTAAPLPPLSAHPSHTAPQHTHPQKAPNKSNRRLQPIFLLFEAKEKEAGGFHRVT